MTYDHFRHGRRSIRLKTYDYASGGAYFVTVCVRGREHVFGEVVGDEMRLNAAGKAVQAAWDDLPAHHPNVSLDAFVVMPNHVHGVFVISNSERRGEPGVRPLQPRGEQEGEHQVRPYGTLAGTLGRIVQRFKSTTTVLYTRGVHDHNWPPFSGKLWQRNYYEHVIRSDDDLNRIREYIEYNPKCWAMDRENDARTGMNEIDKQWFPA